MIGIQTICLKSLEGERLTREEAATIIELPEERLPELLDGVFEIRRKYKGMRVGVQLLTNARSGDCTQNCAYCAQARDSKAEIPKYKLVSEEKMSSDSTVIKGRQLARHCIGLSGMQFSDSEIEEFAERVSVLKRKADTPICCSIGFLTKEQALRLKAAGVDRINHNLNTSRNFYPNICTTHTYDERVRNIRMLQEIGFEICSGGIIGLGESHVDIVEMLLEIREINPQSVPINFLLPIEGSKLESANTAHLTPEFCLKVLCLARLLIPQADIRCAAGREVYLSGREKDLFKIVDSIFASGYLTADGQNIDETIKLVEDAGFEHFIESK